jgi:hypothetical protein
LYLFSGSSDAVSLKGDFWSQSVNPKTNKECIGANTHVLLEWVLAAGFVDQVHLLRSEIRQSCDGQVFLESFCFRACAVGALEYHLILLKDVNSRNGNNTFVLKPFAQDLTLSYRFA